MTTLWDTTGTDVVKALAAERRTGGAVTSGCALTLVVVVDEREVIEAEAAAATAAARHPLRLLVVVRRQIEAPVPRLDAEVTIGGRLGPGESVVMRMYGRLSLHAESVVLPLLAPDVPVVTWWHGPPPEVIAHDPLGVLADRRITDCARSEDPTAALHQRAADYVPGDTDLAWTRVTPWRIHLAAAFDTVRGRATEAVVTAQAGEPSAQLFAGWLRSRLGSPVIVENSPSGRVSGTSVTFGQDGTLRAHLASGQTVVIERDGTPDSTVSLPDRDLGELLAEELRHLDVDQPYADALGAATNTPNLAARPAYRVHIWTDPAQPGTEARST